MNLRSIIEQEKEVHGKSLKESTVLSSARDPYRLDTPANHKLGQWLEGAYKEVNPLGNRTHLRGLDLDKFLSKVHTD